MAAKHLSFVSLRIAKEATKHQWTTNMLLSASFSSCPLWASNYSRCSSRIAVRSKWWSSVVNLELQKKITSGLGMLDILRLFQDHSTINHHQLPKFHQATLSEIMGMMFEPKDKGTNVWSITSPRDGHLTRHQLAVSAFLDLANKPPDLSLFWIPWEAFTSYLAANRNNAGGLGTAKTGYYTESLNQKKTW